MVYNISSPGETEDIGFRLASHLLSGGVRRAYIALCGEMGVGKTVFTRGFARALGISSVKSPTYTIINEHLGKEGLRLFHFDLYRIEGEDDLYSIGYDEYIERDGYSVVEWSTRAGDYIPKNAIYVTISRASDGEECRKIEISGYPCEEI